MLKKAVFCWALVCAAVSSLVAGDVLQKFTPGKVADKTYSFVNAAKAPDVVLPYLGKSASPDWSKAWKGPDFILQREKAIALAVAFQGAGEWEQLVPQKLIPQQRTFVEAGWTDDGVILRVTAMQKHIERVKKVPVRYGRDGGVYNHENVDIAFTSNRNGSQYYQIITDICGITYDASQRRTGKGDLGWNPNLQKKVELLADRWILTILLPLKEVGFVMSKGNFVDINVGRVELTQTEVSSMGPVYHSFNEADKMTRMWFGERRPMPLIRQMTVKNPSVGKNQVMVRLANSADQNFKGIFEFAGAKMNVQLPPKSERNFFLEFMGLPGKKAVTGLLRNAGGQIVDGASLTVEIPKILSIRLKANEVIAGTAVHGSIACCTKLKSGTLAFTCFGKTESYPLASYADFIISTAGKSGKTPVTVALKDEKGDVVVSDTVQLTIQGDPFAEDEE